MQKKITEDSGEETSGLAVQGWDSDYEWGYRVSVFEQEEQRHEWEKFSNRVGSVHMRCTETKVLVRHSIQRYNLDSMYPWHRQLQERVLQRSKLSMSVWYSHREYRED